MVPYSAPLLYSVLATSLAFVAALWVVMCIGAYLVFGPDIEVRCMLHAGPDIEVLRCMLAGGRAGMAIGASTHGRAARVALGAANGDRLP